MTAVLAALAVLLPAVAVIVWQRLSHRRSMNRMMGMLDAAIGGTFTVRTYDETMLSAVENKLGQHLAAAALSARSLQTEKEKIKTLISDISHQTKTPIANLLLYVQLLEERELSPENRALVQSLGGQAEKLRFLIASLVELSRLETGILTLSPRRQPVQALLDEILGQYTPRARERGVALHVSPTGAEAVFDAKWTAEAISNLVDNAIKYTPVGGEVHVSAVEYDLFCRIDVSDTGMGIAEGEQAKVFARFYRSPAVNRQEGVGIGLYLARQILTEQGGYIKVQSARGEGSTFSAFLPRGV